MPEPVENRVLLITGGSRGIGAATARLAARRGYNIAINYRNKRSEADNLIAELQATGSNCMALQGDVAVEADVLRMFSEIDRRYDRLDTLVNNAGIVASSSKLEDMSRERLQRMFDVNILGTFLCAREAVKRMSRRRGGSGGSIVNVSSVATRLGSPAMYVDYAASKAAVDTFTIGLAKEVAAEGIRVNAVLPGIIDTEIHADSGQVDRAQAAADAIPIGRAGTAAEVAAAVLFLLSDESSYTTASLFEVAGGR